MELDLQSLFGLHVYSCTHWPETPQLSPAFGLMYEGTIGHSQDRRHLLLTPVNFIERGVGVEGLNVSLPITPFCFPADSCEDDITFILLLGNFLRGSFPHNSF